MERIIAERKKIREKIIRKVKEWSSELEFKSTVILFGSYSRGDFNVWSDIDILLIAETNKPPHKRLEDIDYPAGFEIIFITPQEFKKLKAKKEKFLIEALNKGIIIRDDYKLTKSHKNSNQI